MNSRFSALILAALTIAAILWTLWYRGWLSPRFYNPPIVDPPLEFYEKTVATTTAETHPLIRVSITENSPLTPDFFITGEAKGQWFFEGSFPVQVRDMEGEILSLTTASAQGDWMTEDFVEFSAQVTLSTDAPLFHGLAQLILMKDNPSGLPENEDSITIPIIIQ